MECPKTSPYGECQTSGAAFSVVRADQNTLPTHPFPLGNSTTHQLIPEHRLAEHQFAEVRYADSKLGMRMDCASHKKNRYPALLCPTLLVNKKTPLFHILKNMATCWPHPLTQSHNLRRTSTVRAAPTVHAPAQRGRETRHKDRIQRKLLPCVERLGGKTKLKDKVERQACHLTPASDGTQDEQPI